jgi:two-component system nitrate/nitrite response regulator NarL
VLPTTIEQQGVFQIAQKKGKDAFTVAIVGNDFLSSCLMVNALTQGLKCEAIPVQPSDLPRILGGCKIDLVIISSDVNSKTGTGFELASCVSRAHSKPDILILLSQSTRETVARAFHSGARAVLNRQESMSELLNCVEHLKTGLIWVGKEESSILLEILRSIPSTNELTESTSNTLTKRELEVVHCAARGKTNRAIASELRLSEHTVKNYLFRAFDKLGVSNRVELLFHLTLRNQSVGVLRATPEKPAEAEYVCSMDQSPRLDRRCSDRRRRSIVR